MNEILVNKRGKIFRSHSALIASMDKLDPNQRLHAELMEGFCGVLCNMGVENVFMALDDLRILAQEVRHKGGVYAGRMLVDIGEASAAIKQNHEEPAEVEYRAKLPTGAITTDRGVGPIVKYITDGQPFARRGIAPSGFMAALAGNRTRVDDRSCHIRPLSRLA